MHIQDPRQWQSDDSKGPSVAKGAAVVLLIGVVIAVVLAIL